MSKPSKIPHPSQAPHMYDPPTHQIPTQSVCHFPPRTVALHRAVAPLHRTLRHASLRLAAKLVRPVETRAPVRSMSHFFPRRHASRRDASRGPPFDERRVDATRRDARRFGARRGTEARRVVVVVQGGGGHPKQEGGFHKKGAMVPEKECQGRRKFRRWGS